MTDEVELSDRLASAQQRLRDGMPPSFPAHLEAPYLTVPAVAELAHCGHKTVRRAIDAGDLTAYRTGRRLVVREQDARAWIESRPARQPALRRAPARRRPAAGSVADLRAIERGRG